MVSGWWLVVGGWWFVVRGWWLVVSRDVVGDHVPRIPPFYGGAVHRHPRLVHRQHVLGARDWTHHSATGKEVADGQSAAEWWRRQFVKNAPYAERTTERPVMAGRVTADESVNIQEMTGDRLNGLR